MEALFGHAVVQPRAKTGEGASETRAAKELGVHILGAMAPRPLWRTWRARAEDGKAVALAVIAESATAPERERFARAADDRLAAADSLRGVLRMRGVAPSRDAFVSDLWTTGTASDLSALRWPLRRRLEFVRKIAQSLQSLHDVGLTHGCLCASNVLLDDDLEPVLGEAAMVSVHALAERSEKDALPYLEFASPEVKKGEEPDARSDVYSAGRLLQELTAGDDAPPVTEILSHCVTPLAKSRYGSAAELAAALVAAVEQLPSEQVAQPVSPPVSPEARAAREHRSKAEAAAAPTGVEQALSSAAAAWTTTRKPALVGFVLLALSVPAAFLLGGSAGSVRGALAVAVPLGAALVTWILPPLPRRPGLGRIALALSLALVAIVLDPLALPYRMVANRQMHGDEGARRAAIDEIVRLGRDFRGMSLVGVDLSGLDLNGADLRGADLSRAQLTGTHLWAAVVEGASFDGANLSGADLDQTALAQALHTDTATCDDKTRLPQGWRCADGHVARAAP
jgi:hypothetical protein